MPSFEVILTDPELASEKWVAVQRYNGHYEVSDMGRVKSLKFYHGRIPGLILKQKIDWNGYCTVDLCLNSKAERIFVHKLVALHFVGPRPFGQECNHKDTVKTNNRHWNLEWMTKKENMEHAAANGCLPSPEEKSRIMKMRAARGDNHGLVKHPERVSRGNRHWTHRPGAQRGEKNPAAKLTDAQRESIRSEYVRGKFGYIRLAHKYGVSPRAIWQIINNSGGSPP